MVNGKSTAAEESATPPQATRSCHEPAAVSLIDCHDRLASPRTTHNSSQTAPISSGSGQRRRASHPHRRPRAAPLITAATVLPTSPAPTQLVIHPSVRALSLPRHPLHLLRLLPHQPNLLPDHLAAFIVQPRLPFGSPDLKSASQVELSPGLTPAQPHHTAPTQSLPAD